MSREWNLKRLRLAAAVCWLWAVPAAGQYLVTTIPAAKPLGIDAIMAPGIFAAVANSGDNTVSIFNIGRDPASPPQAPLAKATLRSLVTGIASPYAAVGPCGANSFAVTSPAANSLSLIDPIKGALTGTVTVGRQPYSVGCYRDTLGKYWAAVSNYGDSSLSIVDLSSMTVSKVILNVPGSRGLHGVAACPVGGLADPRVWVTGTDADVVTVLDVNASKIAASFPVRGPTSLLFSGSGGIPGCAVISIASSKDNSIVQVDPGTLQTVSVIPGIPTPQDFSDGPDLWVTTGPGNSIVQVGGPPTSTIPAIPGAAGIAAFVRYQFSVGAIQCQTSAPCGAPNDGLLVTSPDSNSLLLLQGPPAAPHDFVTANGASFLTSAVAPGTLSSIFADIGVKQNSLAGSVPLPKTLGGVTLRVGGSLDFNTSSGWVYSPTGAVDAGLLYVSPNQINFQVPPSVAVASGVPMQLLRPDGSSLLTATSFVLSSPGVFTLPMNGQGQAAVLNQDNTQNFGTNPARRGSVIQIFATGAGETTPALAAGEAAPAGGNPLVLTKVQPTVTIGGKNAKVQFSGMAPGFVGLWQINAEVPADVTPGMAVPLVITAAGASSNTVTIAVQ
jgi:uncharacterized protein (TIGR03437 family)